MNNPILLMTNPKNTINVDLSPLYREEIATQNCMAAIKIISLLLIKLRLDLQTLRYYRK
jgi:hypothetical protein